MKISVKVKPRAKVEKVEEKDGDLVVFVKAEAKEGKANIAVIKALAAHFEVAKSRVRLLTGARSKTKLFEIL